METIDVQWIKRVGCEKYLHELTVLNAKNVRYTK